MLPPLGACIAMRMHWRISSSVTASAVKRRTARVVVSASKRSMIVPPPRRASSASLEHGRTLLADRRERFLMILAAERDELERRRGVERDVQRILYELVHRELGVADRERRARSEARRERHRLRVERRRWDDAVHEADALRLRGAERVAGEQILLGAR